MFCDTGKHAETNPFLVVERKHHIRPAIARQCAVRPRLAFHPLTQSQ
jgi:hypothetical protein